MRLKFDRTNAKRGGVAGVLGATALAPASLFTTPSAAAPVVGGVLSWCFGGAALATIGFFTVQPEVVAAGAFIAGIACS